MKKSTNTAHRMTASERAIGLLRPKAELEHLGLLATEQSF